MKDLFHRFECVPAFAACLVVCVSVVPVNAEDAHTASLSEPMTSQKTLDFFATFTIPNAPVDPNAPYLPSGPFASWSAQDRQSVPQKIANLCEFMWVMAHDNPNTRILPSGQADADEEIIGAYICIAGHMPLDWPERTRVVLAAKDIISRAKQLGSGLSPPQALAR